MATKLLFNMDEVAEMIGVRKSTILRMLQAKEIASFKVGRLRKVSREAVTTWVKRQEEQAVVRVGDKDCGE